MKRFYKTVAVAPVADGYQVMLDRRPLRTPAQALLVVPALALAEAMAEEWRGQGEVVRPLSMGMTRLANTGLDRVRAERGRAVEDVVRYGGSDLLCYRADAPPELVSRQRAAWQPWLDWAAVTLGATLAVGTGVVHVAQDPGTLAALRLAVARANDLELAGIGAAVQPLGSLVLGLALWRGALAADQAVALSLLDERYQAERWGEDQEALARRRGLQRDVADAGRFLSLLRDG